MATDDGQTRGWVQRLSDLHTPVVADALDRLGYREQSLRADIRPLSRGMVAAGVARTIRTISAPELATAEPYKREMAAVDALRPDDIVIVSECQWSFWGELLSTAARHRGCRGVIIDGYTRDTRAIIAMGFPVFCRGIHPADSLGRLDVAEHDVPIDCGGVLLQPGDFVLADDDGVVVVPHAIAEQVLTAAEEKLGREGLVRKALSEGLSVTEAFRRYGVL